MATRYSIALLDPNTVVGGNPAQVAILSDWKVLQYRMALNAPGDVQLDIDAASRKTADGSLLTDIFTANLDLMLVIYREDPEAIGGPIAKYVDGEFFARTFQHYQESSGAERFVSYGRGLTDLLARRIIAYPSDDPGAEKEGKAETILKEYISENLGPLATVVNGREADGVAPNFTVQADGGLGDTWFGSRAWRNLLDVAQEIAAYDPSSSNLGFDFLVVSKLRTRFAAPPDWLEFKVGRPWGLNRTVGNGVNAPAIFSTGNGNMLLPQYSESHIEEKSRVYALGQGQDADREIWPEDDAARIASSPWNLAEMIRNANMEEEEEGLEVSAKVALSETGPRKTFTFQPLQTSGSRYGRDYNLGDLITARYKGTEFTRKIVGVTVRVSAEGGTGGQREEIRLDLGEVSPFGVSPG